MRVELINIVDESGEDYLYPGEFFWKLQIPLPVKKALARAALKKIPAFLNLIWRSFLWACYLYKNH